MAKQLKLMYDGKEYTLEFTRRAIQQMESEGFVITDIDKKPMTAIPRMFAGAFKAHHKFVDQKIINEIFDNITDKEGLMEALGEMYSEPLTSLLEDPEESEKNVAWETNWK